MRTSEKNDADVLKGGESMSVKDDDKLQETNRKSAKGKGVMSRFMGVILAAAVAFGTFGAGVGMWLTNHAEDAWAISGSEWGNYETFAEKLPATEVHIDRNAMVNPQITYSNNKFQNLNGTITIVDQMYSNHYDGSDTGPHTYAGKCVVFTFKDAAILSNRTRADVVVTLSDVSIHTGPAGAGNNKADPHATTDALRGYPQVMQVSGLAMKIGVEEYGTSTGSNAWRYGIDCKLNVAVPDAASGDIIYGVTGMTVSRANVGTITRIGDSEAYDYFSESTVIRDGATTTGIYYAKDGYKSNVVSKDDALRIVGASNTSGITPPDVPTGTDSPWDKSFLTGFITEANAANGMTTGYRAGGGNNNGATVGINSGLFPAAAYILDISSSPGGQVFMNKDGSLGEELGQGLYSIPRGKDVVVKLKPDNNEYYPEVVYAGDYQASGHTATGVTPTRVVENGQVYYTYTFPDIDKDSELYVKWAPLPAQVKATKEWDDESDKFDNRGNIKFTLDPAILPSQEINEDAGDTYSVEWGTGAGFTGIDASGNTVQVPVDYTTGAGYDSSYEYWYNNSTYTWVPYNKSAGGYETGVKESPKAVQGGTAIQTDFLPKYNASGTVIDYSSVKEENVDPSTYDISDYYDTEPTDIVSETNKSRDDDVDASIQAKTASYEYKIKNTLKTLDFTITKNWNDDSNAANKRPTADDFKALLKFYWKTSGTVVPDWVDKTTDFDNYLTITDNGDNTFTATWANLPEFYTLENTSYQAEEATEPTDYKRETSGKVDNGATITNTLKKDVYITKQWNDNNDLNHNRLETDDMISSFALYSDESCEQVVSDAPTPEITDNNDGTYKVEWKGVAKYDSAGNERTYYAKETAVPTAYTITQGANGVAETTGVIINTEKTQAITLTKTWDDEDAYTANKGYTRPAVKIKVTGKITGQSGEETAFEEEYELTSANPVIGDDYKWRKTFTGLPIYYKNQVITYTTEEITPDGFTKVDGSVTSTTTDGNTVMDSGATNTPNETEAENPVYLKVKKVDAQTTTGIGLGGAVFTVSGTDSEGTAVADKVETTGDDGYATFTFDVPGNYTLVETTAPTGYTKDSTTYNVVVDKTLTSISLNQAKTTWEWLYDLVFGTGTDVTYTYDATTKTGTATIENEPIKGMLQATKTWDDNDNQDGVRRNSYIQLQKSLDGGTSWNDVRGKGEDVYTVYTTARYPVKIFGDLPAYEDGVVVMYRVSEDTINNYTTTYDTGQGTTYEDEGAGVDLLDSTDAAGNTTTLKSIDVKNTHVPAKTQITITKAWDDDDYDNPGQTGTNGYERPDLLTFNITGKANGVDVTLPDGKDSVTITPTDKTVDDQWTALVDGLPAYHNTGVTSTAYEIVYSVAESVPAGFEMTVTSGMSKDPNTGNWTIGVTNTPIESKEYNPTGITVKKTDANTGNVLQGGEFTIYQANGVTPAVEDDPSTTDDDADAMVDTNTITIGTNGLGTAEFKKPGTYIIKETAAPTGYVAGTGTYQIVVDEQLKTIEFKQVGSDNFWNWIYDLVYGTPAPTGWDSGTNTLTVPNTPETTSLTVAKQWHDQQNQDGKRVDSLDFKLTANAAVFDGGTSTEKIQTMSNIHTEMIDDYDAGTITFTNLPIYRDGQKVTYSIEEVAVPTGYTDAYYYQTNYTTEKNSTELDTTAANNRFVVRNSHTPDKINIEFKKVWDDNNNQDGKRAASTAVTLYVNNTPHRNTGTVKSDTESGSTVYTWSDLDAYSGGQPVTYRIEETAMPGYTTTYALAYTDASGDPATGTDTVVGNTISQVSGANTATFTITNAYTPETTSVSVAKTWDDNSDQDGFRSSVNGTMTLYKKVGSADGTAVPGAEIKTVETTDGWTDTWTNLPVYENGTRIKYYVVESGDFAAAGYTKSGDGEATAVDATSGNSGTITVTNTHTPQTAWIKVTKNWDDASDQDGFRPDSLEITLKGTVPSETPGANPVEVGTYTLTATGSGDEWNVSKTDLPVYYGGQKITYTITEDITAVNTKVTAASSPNAYAVTYNTQSGELTANTETELELTNARNTDTTEITIVKTWDDADLFNALSGTGNEYIRPENLGFTVTAKVGNTPVDVFDNGTSSTTTDTLTGARSDARVTTWSKTITDLQKYYDGQAISYTASETLPDGYDKTAEGDLTVTNKPLVGTDYTPTSISVMKVDADGNGTGLPGASFAIYQADGVTPATEGTGGQVDSRTGTTGSAGTTTFTFNLPGTYVIKETAAPTGYNLNTTSYTIEVDKDLSKISYKGSSNFWEWLYSLFVGNGSTGNWDANMQVLTVSDTAKTTSLTVAKQWHDNNNQDGLRKETLSFTLSAAQGTSAVNVFNNNTESTSTQTMTDISTVMLDDYDAGTVTFTNLPMYRDGQLITYTAAEDAVPTDYTVSYDKPDGTTLAEDAAQNRITAKNTHTPKTIKVKVVKLWDDDDNAGGKRDNVDSDIVLTQEAGGATTTAKTEAHAVTSTTVHGATVAEWDSIPVYSNGQPIKYTVTETTANGYATSYFYNIDGGSSQDGNTFVADPTKGEYTVTVTNTEILDITVKKTWVDGAVSNVTYQLYRTISTDPDVTNWNQAKTGTTSDIDQQKTIYNWNPATAEGNWEKVQGASRVFLVDVFDPSRDPDYATATFTGLPKYDESGNLYHYRVYEETAGGDKFEADQIDDFEITNTNKYKGSGIVKPNVVKELSGRKWIDVDGQGNGDKFYFKIEATGGKDLTTGADIDPADVPLPKDGQGNIVDTAYASTSGTAVGALGYSVNFESIVYTSDATTSGHTFEYYYDIYEVDENENKLAGTTVDGITYDDYRGTGTDDHGVGVHTLKVVAVDHGDGTIEASRYWDGNTELSAVPVYTNTYDAFGSLSPYIVKRIDGRVYKAGDTFSFNAINVSGSVLRGSKDDAGTTQSQSEQLIATVDNTQGTYVDNNGSQYTTSGGTSGDIKAIKTSFTNWFRLSDLTMGEGENVATGTFIYQLVEDGDNSAADGNDLKFDTDQIYLKADVTDNTDGTLDIQTSYWKDAACTIPLDGTVLINTKTGEMAEAGKTDADPDYDYVPAAVFNNGKVAQITVKKKWVSVDEDGNETTADPADNAVIRLNRYGVQDPDNPGTLPTDIDEWDNVETYTFDRGDFYTADFNGQTYTQTEAARKVIDGEITQADFDAARWSLSPDASYTFTDLPLHEMKNGTDLWYIYRVYESTGSESFTSTYSTDGTTWKDKWTETDSYLDGEVIVKNTLKAANEANVAAVKQFIGRQWLSTDDFEFTLEPVGYAEYDKDGNPTGINTDTTKVPMPEDDAARESSTVYPQGGVAISTTHAGEDKTKYPVVDKNGRLERLARFGAIKYNMTDLVYDPADGNMQGDFYYIMKEKIPDDAKATINNTEYTYTDAKAALGEGTITADQFNSAKFEKNGITYDGDTHTVHVKVRENHTQELVVQVAYDYSDPDDISTGTQFTPVYTNRYDAATTISAYDRKYVMGRSLKDGEEFVFQIEPVGGAPFRDTNGNKITVGYLEDIIKVGADGTTSGVTSGYQYVYKKGPAIQFNLSDLNLEVVGDNGEADPDDNYNDAVIYSSINGTPASGPGKKGMKYGRFMYSVKESRADATDLELDPDKEYVLVTVVDLGDGTLGTDYKIYDNPTDLNPRYEPGSSTEPATMLTLVNQLKRNLKVTKAWAGTATSDVTLKLQWTTDDDPAAQGASWHDADGTSWLAGVEAVKKIEREASGNDLTVTFEDLPAYLNDTGDNKDLNDKWVYYRVVEEAINNVTTVYSTKPYADGDTPGDTSKYSANPVSTEKEDADTRITQTYVTNFPGNLTGIANVDVVKQFIGNVWANETFTFKIEPVSNTVGMDVSKMPMPVKTVNKLMEYKDGSGTLYYYDAKTGKLYTSSAGDTPAPSGVSINDLTPVAKNEYATATNQTTSVSINEHDAKFDPIPIKLTDLKYDPTDKVDKGEFVYEIYEVVADPKRTIKEGGKDYYVKDNIKYTTEKHTVKITAINDGSGKITTTVSYDNRAAGDFVPVYTNYALHPTPITGTKTWIGGKADEHVNSSADATATDNQKAGTDQLGLVLQRTTTPDNPNSWQDVDVTDAGNEITFIWDNVTGDARYTIMAINKDQTNPEAEDYLLQPVLDVTNAAGYEYHYRVREKGVPTGYKVTYDEQDTGKTITNTCVKTDSIKVTKTWDDAQNVTGLRPKNDNGTQRAIVHLYKEVTEGSGGGTTVTKQVEVEKKEITKQSGDTDDVWSAGITWDNLPVYDKDGNKIKYIVIEESEYGYATTYKVTTDTSVTDYAVDGNSLYLDEKTSAPVIQTIDVKNTLTPATNTVEVTKVWNDNDNIDGKRPGSVTLKLYKYVWDATAGAYSTNKQLVSGDSGTGRPATPDDVTAAEAADPQSTLKVGDNIKIEDLVLDGTVDTSTDTQANETASWEGSWINLPLTENEKTIIYVVEEDVDGSEYDAAGTQGKYSNEPVITGDQINGYKVENIYTPELTSASVTKVWKDNNNAFGNRPATLTMELWRAYKGAEGNAVHKKVTADANGYTIKHEMSEDDKIADNTWKLEYTKLPKSLVVDTTSGKESRPYTYYWKETVPAGYLATADPGADPTPGLPKEVSDAFALANGETVTNTQITGELTVTKEWDDADDQDGLRADAIDAFKENLKLYADGQEVTVDTSGTPAEGAVTKTVTDATDTTPLTVVYTNLPVYNGGSEITYSVDEGVIANYTLKSAVPQNTVLEVELGDTVARGSIALTNEHTPGTTEIAVTKAWNEVDDKHRPTIAQLQAALKLYADGTEKTGVTPEISINNDGNWTIRYTNLTAKKNKGGQSVGIVYTVEETGVNTTGEETPVAGFAYYEDGATYDNSNAQDTPFVQLTPEQKAETDKVYNGGTITNKQTYKDITVRKVWNDKIYDFTTKNNIVNPGRPATISLTLTGDNTGDAGGATTRTAETVESTSEDNRDYKFEMMPVYAADGTTKINYTLSEAAIPGYDTKVIKEVPFSGGIMAVVNTYQVTKLTGSKVWVDDGKTHNNATEVTLTVNYQRYDSAGNPVGEPGTVTDPVISWGTTEATKNNYEVGGLPVGDGKGNTYRYWAVETPITGYNTSCKNADDLATEHVDESTITGYALNGGIITNTAKVGDVTITKTFVDDEGNAIAIPAEVLEDFNIIVDYTEVKDGASASKTETLEVKDGTPSADGKTYTWEIADVAYGTNVHVHEQDYMYITGYDYDGTDVEVNVPGATTHDDDASFTMPDEEARVEFTNVYMEQTGWIRLIKLWDDDSNRDGKRPGEVTFKVTATYKDDSGNPVPAPVFDDGKSEKTVTFDNDGDTAADTWSYENLGNLPLYYKGNEVTYKVDEPNVPAEYTKDIIGSEGINLIPYEEEMLAIINKYEPETGSVKVTKAWDDDNNKAGLRAEVKVYLYADGTLVGEIEEGTVKTTDGDVVTWSDLPIYTADGTDGDKKIRYTVKETAVPGYTTSFSYAPEPGVELVENATEPSTIAITNKHVPETGELTIKKVWDDNDDQDGFRAGSITVKLYAKTIDGGEAKVFDGASDKEVTISAADSWKYEFTGDTKLPATYDGKAVIYYVDGDTETFDGGDKSKYTHTFVERTGDTEITVTNIHKPEEGCVEVLKVWDDNNNQDGKRQDAVMTLKATTGTETTTVGEKTISADINEPQEAVWHDQPVYRNGEKITYTVEEAEIDGYTPSVSDPVQLDGDNDTKKITVTNTYEPETTSVTVIKKWKDGDDQDKKRSDVTMHLKGIIEGAEFKSLNFEDKIIPVNTTAKDGEDAGTTTWTDLPVYHDGKKITYDVTEEAVPGYTSNVEMSEGHATVTNERATDVTYVEVTKVWNDADNVDGMRTDVTVTLEKTVDGKKSDVDSKTIATGDNHDENMTASWSGLPANEDGKPITYTVREDDINGYTGETSSTEPGKFTITNTHEPEKTNVKVTKVWDDNNNADRLRPNSVNVVLYADGKPVEIKSITTPEDAQTESKVTFTVPKNRTGAHDEAITYTVKEEKVPEGYTASEPTGDQHKGYTITNTHVTETASLKITKIWDDNDDQDGLRPEELKVKVTGDDTKAPYEEEVTLKRSGDWITTLEGLRLYKVGTTDQKVTYTISGETVEVTDDYKVIFDTDETNDPDYIIVYGDPTTLEADRISELTVTNKHESETINIAVDKKWTDSHDQDGVRPNEVRIELSNDFDDNIKVITLNAQNNWTDIFRGLRKNSSNGNAIAYKVAETVSAALENAGYVAEPKQNKDGSWTITNTRNENDITQVTLTKIWDDGDDQEGFRPNAATFADSLVLKADGTEIGRKPATKTDNGDGTYTYTWTGLQKNRTKTSETQETAPIDYKVEEKTVPDEYTASKVNGNMADGFSITNTHAVRSIDVMLVTKVWIDGNSRDGKRPDSLDNKMLIWATTSDDPENAPDEEWTLIGNALLEDNDGLDGIATINEWREGESITGERLDVNGDLTLPAYQDGKLVTYYLAESFEKDGGKDYTITYKRDEEIVDALMFDFESSKKYTYDINTGKEFLSVINSKDVDFTVTKKWDDKDSNAVRPDKDTYKDSLKLYVTAEDGNTTEVTKDYAGKLNVVVNYDGTYTATWSALPQYTDEPNYNGGNRLHYHVVEDRIEGYNEPVYSNVDDPTVFKYNDGKAVDESAVTDKAYDHGVITNTAVTYDSLKITKAWDDWKNAEGLRPDSVTFHLYKKIDDGQVSAGVEAKTIAADADPAEAQWDDLPVYENGEKITYVVVEEAVAGYKTEYDGAQEVQLDGTTGAQLVNVTNSITPATANVAVTKIWDDESNRDGKRPADGVTFKLYERVWDETAKAYGDETEASYSDGMKVADLTLDGTNDGDTVNKWSGEFTNLPETKNGKTVIYYVKEETDLTTGNYKAAVVTGNQIDGYEITNSRNADTTSASITKIWLDSSARFMRPDTLELELWRYYEGADGNLAYERVTADADGNAVKTTISYDDALEGDEDRWAITVPNLPVNNEQGKAYTYYWKEAVPANYETPTIRPEDYPAPDDPEMTERIVQVANGGSILNMLSTFDLRVFKIWADGNNREDKRPLLSSMYLEATTDDPEANDAEWKPVGNAYVQLNDNHDGQVRVTNWRSGRETIDSNGKIILPVAEDGNVITYRLTERDQGNEYTTSYKLANSDDVKTGGITFTFRDTGLYSNLIVNVTNSLDPDFSVTKKWVDEEGNTVRPSADKYKESLKLFATEFIYNDETDEYDPKTNDVTEKFADKLKVNDNGDGTYTAIWKGLPQYGEDDLTRFFGDHIVYHVEETKVDGYEDAAYSNTEDPTTEQVKEAEATDKAYDHGVITNTQDIPQRTIKVTKVWDDEDILGTDGYVRPKDVSVQLYKGEGEDEEAYGDPVGLSEANKWTYSWSVPAEANGKPIAYTIKEVNVPAGFTSSGDVKVSADQAEEGYTITNTPKPGEKVNSIDLVVVKTNKKDDVPSLR